MKKIILTLAVAATAIGCANGPQKLADIDESERKYHYAWSKDGANADDFKKAHYECETSVQQRFTAATEAMNQYKYARNNMGIVGLSLKEPEEIEEEDLPKMIGKCLDGQGWKAKKTPVTLAPGQDMDEASDTHSFQTK